MAGLVEGVDGRQAYELVLGYLNQPHCTSSNLERLCPNRFFHLGWDGYGLILSGGLIYVTGEDVGDKVWAVEEGINEIRFGNPSKPVKWRSIEGEIPKDAILAATSFAWQVRTACEALGCGTPFLHTR